MRVSMVSFYCAGVMACALDVASTAAAAGGDLAAEPSVYRGMCDASAAVWLSPTLFAVANDEDNIIRVYDRSGTVAVTETDLSGFLKVDPKEPEADIEAAARVDDTVYWITSHGRNKNGKERESRRRFFATKIIHQDGKTFLGPTGQPYAFLLADLLKDDRFNNFGLAAASRRAPKDENGLNIEGLAAKPDGTLLIGFRNPLPQTKALVVPLLNPSEVIKGSPARLGTPILLDLEGKGIRSITEWKGGFLIIAGRHGEGGISAVYRWMSDMEKPTPLGVELPGTRFNPEAVAVGEGNEMLLVSDDGTLMISGTPCKELKDKSRQQFRAVLRPLPVSADGP